MPPKRIENGTVIILDIGRNVSEQEEKNEKSFFELARECTTRIIERKIISQGNNLLGIILLGSKDTKNKLAESGCKYIETYAELQYPNWQMIRHLPDKPSKARGNWFDALLVAVDSFKSEISAIKILSKQIIFMTNFLKPSGVEDSDLEQIVIGLQEDGFQVDIIGLNIYSNENKNEEIEHVKKIVEGTNGVSATFEFAMRYLLFHKKKAVNSVPWNVDLNLGPSIKIPVSLYIRLKDEPVVKKWLMAIKDPVTNTKSNTEYVQKSKVFINPENQTIMDKDKNIKGYQYGQQIIPFSDCDEAMLYDSGPKSLSVYGFTKASNITWQCLNGDGLSFVFGRKGDKKAQYTIRCLVECLHELNLVGIVRRVHNNGNAPKMYALMPVIDPDNMFCLSMIGICYKDEIKNMSFPSTDTKKYACSEEQVNAFVDLIKSMDLMRAYEESDYDESEAFPIASVVSPSAQYVLDCIAFRAMNPGKPLPQPRDDITMLFKIPPLVEKRSKESLEKLKSLFVLNKVEIKKREKKKKDAMDVDRLPHDASTSNSFDKDMDDIPKIDLNALKEPNNEIKKVGTQNPINDFEFLKKKGVSMTELARQITGVIERLIYEKIDRKFTKFLEVLSHFRQVCIKSEPSHYNDFIKYFRFKLKECKRSDVSEVIDENKLGYILKNENILSNIESDSCGDSQVYETDTVPITEDITISSEVNDLFDNM